MTLPLALAVYIGVGLAMGAASVALAPEPFRERLAQYPPAAVVAVVILVFALLWPLALLDARK